MEKNKEIKELLRPSGTSSINREGTGDTSRRQRATKLRLPEKSYLAYTNYPLQLPLTQGES